MSKIAIQLCHCDKQLFIPTLIAWFDQVSKFYFCTFKVHTEYYHLAKPVGKSKTDKTELFNQGSFFEYLLKILPNTEHYFLIKSRKTWRSIL